MKGQKHLKTSIGEEDRWKEKNGCNPIAIYATTVRSILLLCFFDLNMRWIRIQIQIPNFNILLCDPFSFFARYCLFTKLEGAFLYLFLILSRFGTKHSFVLISNSLSRPCIHARYIPLMTFGLLNPKVVSAASKIWPTVSHSTMSTHWFSDATNEIYISCARSYYQL